MSLPSALRFDRTDRMLPISLNIGSGKSKFGSFPNKFLHGDFSGGLSQMRGQDPVDQYVVQRPKQMYEDAKDKTKRNMRESINHVMEMFRLSLKLRQPYRDMGARALEFANRNIGKDAPLERMMSDYGGGGTEAELEALGMGDRAADARAYFGDRLAAGEFDRRTGRLKDLVDISQGITSRGAGMATASGSRRGAYGATAGNLATQGYIRAADAADEFGKTILYGAGRGANDYMAYRAANNEAGPAPGGYGGQMDYNEYLRARGYR